MVSKVKIILPIYFGKRPILMGIGLFLSILFVIFIMQISKEKVIESNLPAPEVEFLTRIGRKFVTKYYGTAAIQESEIDWGPFEPSADGVIVEHPNNPAIWERLENMPNLRFLDLGKGGIFPASFDNPNLKHRYFLESDLENLTHLAQLKSLIFPRFPSTGMNNEYDKPVFKYLAPLQKLNYLDISLSNYNCELDALPILESLETLKIKNIYQLSDSSVEHLKQFPNLKVLIVATPKKFPSGISEKSLAHLQSLKQIKQLYISKDLTSGFNSITEQLPDKSIFANNLILYRSSKKRLKSGSFIIAAFIATLSLGFGFTIFTHFSRWESQLIPNFNSIHSTIQTSILFFLVCLGTLLQSMLGVSLIASLSLSTIAVCSIIIYTFPKLLPIWGIVSFLYLIGFSVWNSPSFDAAVNSFLSGKFPVASLLILSTGVSILIWRTPSLKSIFHQLEKHKLPTSISSIFDLLKNNTDRWEKIFNGIQPKTKLKKIDDNFPSDLDFNVFLSSDKEKQTKLRLKAWKRASLFSQKTIISIGLICPISWLSTQWILKTFTPYPYNFADSFNPFNLWVFSCAFSLFLCGFACWNWKKRVPMLVNEYFFPSSKTNLLRNLYRCLFSDIACIPFIILVLVMPVLMWTQPFITSLIWTPLLFFTSCAFTYVGYGLSLWTLQAKSPLLLVISIFICFIFLMSPISPNLPTEANPIGFSKELLIIFAICIFVFGLVLTQFAKAKWNRLEFAKLV